MTNTKLQHEDGEKPASQVTVHYDGKFRNFEVDDNGVVEVENREQVRQLTERHGKFQPVNEDEVKSMDHVLADKTVEEAEEYISTIEKVSRLKELRREEDRKTAVEAIDQRIAEVKEQEEPEEESEEENVTKEQAEENREEEDEEENQDEVSNEDEKEDGEEDQSE